jgi:sarcosine oxidase
LKKNPLQRTPQVLGLETQPRIGHDKGSSHGGSRIIRLVYQEHPSYVDMLHRSYELWRELEATTKRQLLVTTGCLNVSAPAGKGAHGHSLYTGALLSAAENNLKHEALAAEQVNSRFPALHVPSHYKAVLDPVGGFLLPEACIQAHVEAAQACGADVECNTPVLRWNMQQHNTQGDDGSSQATVTVETPRGKYIGRTLVVTAGAWIPKLLPHLSSVLRVERQVVGWFETPSRSRECQSDTIKVAQPTQRTANDVRSESAYSPQRLPVFMVDDEHGNYYYGFPADEHGVKVGLYHHLRQTTEADCIDRRVHQADETALRKFLRDFMPELSNAPIRHSSVCMFTNSSDMHFILDKLNPQLVLGSACSGHGFKFAPCLGEVLADLVMDRVPSVDLKLHRLDARRPGHAEVLRALQARL